MMDLFGNNTPDFVAIDFETATSALDSACSVAVVSVEEGEVADSYYTLIRPPQNIYTEFNITIHGIRPEDTENAKNFAAIWEDLKNHLEHRTVFAHNAPFDMGVLRACLKAHEIAPVEFSYGDTVQVAKKMWRQLPNHKLNTVGAYMGIDFHHHDALEDARTCAWIPIKAAQETGAKDTETLLRKLDLRTRSFSAFFRKG